jgi:hypothetical protein
VDPGVQKRMAENEATFRDANEQIQRRARELGFEDAVPFLCECGKPECREVLRLRLDEYESVRSEPAHFFVVPGHELSEPEGSLVERRDGYVVIEKTGIAGEVAERRDPRQKA